MHSKEDKLNELIEQMKTNPEARAGFGADEELSPLLHAAAALLAIPKKEIPEPAMQRKYLLASKPLSHGAYFFHFTRLFQGIAAAVIFVLLGSTTYATMNSLPGEKLFKLKKTAENIQLKLTSDPVDKANFQLELTERRLAEAQEVIMGPHKNPELEIAVLNELASQTQTAIEEIKTVTTATAEQKDLSIVAKLENVSNKQKELLSQIDSKDETKAIASSAITKNQVAIREIMQVVAVSNEETKASLEPEQQPQATTTEVTAIDVPATASSTTSTQASTSAPTLIAPKKPDASKKPEPAPTSTPETGTTAPTPDSNIATGTFILEDPTDPNP